MWKRRIVTAKITYIYSVKNQTLLYFTVHGFLRPLKTNIIIERKYYSCKTTFIISDTTITIDETYVEGFDFSDISIRRGFAKKILSLLLMQLIVTICVIIFLLFCGPVRTIILYLDLNFRLYFILASIVAQITIVVILACFRKLRRHSPTNYIMLLLFTIIMALWMACIDLIAIVGGIGLAVFAIICFSLLLFTLLTKYDFTIIPQVLFSFFVCAVLFGILVLATPLRIELVGYASLITLFFYLFLIFDVWLMVGEKHYFSISPEEYIFATLVIYIDIIILILRIAGRSRC